MVALFLVGATDMVSVIIRATLVQFATPDAMRGRVNAVDMLFIGASNELGEFESGLTAHWFGRAGSCTRRRGNADRDRIVGLAISGIAKSGSTASGVSSSGQTRASAPWRFVITCRGSPSWRQPCYRSGRRPGSRPRARPDRTR